MAAAEIDDVIESLAGEDRWRTLHDLLVIARGAGWQLDDYKPRRRRSRFGRAHRLIGLNSARAFLVLEFDMNGHFHGRQTLKADGRLAYISGDGCDALDDVLREYGTRRPDRSHRR